MLVGASCYIQNDVNMLLNWFSSWYLWQSSNTGRWCIIFIRISSSYTLTSKNRGFCVSVMKILSQMVQSQGEVGARQASFLRHNIEMVWERSRPGGRPPRLCALKGQLCILALQSKIAFEQKQKQIGRVTEFYVLCFNTMELLQP